MASGSTLNPTHISVTQSPVDSRPDDVIGNVLSGHSVNRTDNSLYGSHSSGAVLNQNTFPVVAVLYPLLFRLGASGSWHLSVIVYLPLELRSLNKKMEVNSQSIVGNTS